MDKDTAERDTTVATLTLNTKVLAIGGRKETGKERKSALEYDRNTFLGDCKNYLSLLLMGTRIPMAVADDSTATEWCGVKPIMEGNRTVRYQFYCHRPPIGPSHYIMYCKTFSASATMREIRKLLKEERWISKYEIKAPIKTAFDTRHYNSENYFVDCMVYRACNAECERIFAYLFNLHREYVQNNL
ncbi:uncharacterized protein Dvir_GJ25670 [Drosophila virilis]|uniref:Uncharacterized protein n=1 Tax=Drosophila virilis TaxID=7244 RepID=A0A0Q9WGR4_DROVI|nr:uncharacterized protein Dvir_GJ25670 [Drosophila virilis]